MASTSITRSRDQDQLPGLVGTAVVQQQQQQQQGLAVMTQQQQQEPVVLDQ